MSQTLSSPRLALPLLAAGQAQKEVTHNEALALIDAAIAPSVVAVGTATPPASPAPGDCWIVGAGAGGAWTGQAGKLAIQTGGGWRFVAMPVGSIVVVATSGERWTRTAAGWQPPATIGAPTGGVTVDSEARATLNAVLNALSARGFIALAP